MEDKLSITRHDDMKTAQIITRLLNNEPPRPSDILYMTGLCFRFSKILISDLTPDNYYIVTDVLGKYNIIVSILETRYDYHI